MSEQEEAVIVVIRATGYWGWLLTLNVLIDGEWVGRLRPRGKAKCVVAPGTHVVTVTLGGLGTGQVCILLRAGERIEFACQTNQVPIHPWFVHGGAALLVVGALLWVGSAVPAIRRFVQNNLIPEVFLSLALAWIGMIAYIWKLYKTGSGRHPRLILSQHGNGNEWQEGS